MVSVIIPTYNRREYVQEAIDSVLAQTYSDYEIIVVDDGSSDGTGEAIRGRYGNRINYLWQTNSGGPAARNHGWRMSRGAHLIFLDSDDRLVPTALDVLRAEVMADLGLGVVGGAFRPIDEVGLPIRGTQLDPEGRELGLRDCLLAFPFIPSSALVNRGWFAKVGGFDEAQEAAQDWDLWLRLSAAGCRMRQIGWPVSEYRIHGSGLTASIDRQKRGKLRAFNKVFAQNDLPPAVLAVRQEVYANVHLWAAARKYANNLPEAARQDLVHAGELMPEWRESGRLLESLLRLGTNPQVTTAQEDYQRVVLRSLPRSLFSRRDGQAAMARIAAGRLFETYARHDLSRVGRLWWIAVTRNPIWLRDLGMWSILSEAMLGSRATSVARVLLRKVLRPSVLQTNDTDRR